MLGIAILLVGASAGFGIARWARVPAIPMLLIVGVVLGALGVLPPMEMLQNALSLGVTFLVFVAGIELNPDRVRRQRTVALWVGSTQFLLLGLLGLGAALALGYDLTSALFLALALTASSTLVVVRLLQQRQRMFEPFGRLVIGVLLLQDLLVILLIPVLTRLREGAVSVLAGVLGVLLLVALAYVLQRHAVPRLVEHLGLDEESLLLSVLAILFIFAGLAFVLRLPLAAAAFLAGVSLSSFPINGVVRGQLGSISDFFLAIFFTALGAFVLPLSGEVLLKAAALALLVLVATPPLVVLIAERSGLSARQAVESGLLLAQTSELSLVLALQGWSAGQIEAEVFTVIALVTVATMILTPFLTTDRLTWRLMRLHPSRQQPLIEQVPGGHVLLLGCGESGMPLLETLLSSGHEVLVVDDDPAVITRLSEGEIPCIRGDGSDFTVLETARAREARAIISTMRRPRDSENLLRYVGGVPTFVRVFDDMDAARISELGGEPVLYSAAAVDDFLTWLDQAEAVGLPRERRQRPRLL